MAYLPQRLIAKKRDGQALDADEIGFLAQGLTDGSLSEGQAAAFAMAVFFRGMDLAERVALTRAMAASGRHLTWDLDRPTVDKHSTGGVGDKVSLMLAPLVAACGAAVPMISGRGLGHTGGTLDKLAAIPGYDPFPAPERFAEVVRTIGCAVIGQTADLAPADRRLYAIRDVTATVESTPLIVASILSKKLAAGLSGLVLDVKAGSGAFLTDWAATRDLAQALVAVATGAGLPTTAWLTDMDQVLGRTAGNALEVREAVEYLGGRREPRLDQVTRALAVEMLILAKLAPDRDAAAVQVAAALDSGAAAERFARMVAALGGPADLFERIDAHLAPAPVVRPAFPGRAGTVAAIDVRAVGFAVVALGGGRTRADQAIDPAVGLTEVAAIGETVGPDRPLALVHARDPATAEAAIGALAAAYRVVDGPVTPLLLLRERI